MERHIQTIKLYSRQLMKDYTFEGIVISIFYILTTMIIPHAYFVINETYRNMNKLQSIVWISLLATWQIMIIQSIYQVLRKQKEKTIENDEEYHKNLITYNLFVKGGWANFQKMIRMYAEDIWHEIIFVSLIFMVPTGLFKNKSGSDKLKIIFGKLGLFYVFTFVILGPPKYDIKSQEFNIFLYLQKTLGFEGDMNSGLYNYIYKNKERLYKVIVSITLLIIISINI